MMKVRVGKMKTFKEEELVSHGDSVFKRAVLWRGEVIEERWKTSSDLYDGRFSPTKGEKEKSEVLANQGRLFIPKTYSHTQRMLIDILDTIFFDPEEIVSVNTDKMLPFSQREIVKVLLNYRLNGHPINFYQESLEACLDALKNKIGIFKIYPKLDMKKFNVNNQIIDVIFGFVPMLECCPFEDVFFDPRATWKDYYKFPIVHRMMRTRDELKKRGYKNVDLIEGPTEPTLNDQTKDQRMLDQGSPFGISSNNVKALDSVVIYEFWTFLDFGEKDGGVKSASFIMGGDSGGPKVIIRDVEENTLPYMIPGEDYNRPPIIVGQGFPEPHKMYGKDLPEIVEGLQRETNAQRNQRREAVALALRKPILANRNAGLDLMTLVNRKIGSVVLGDDVSDQSVRELNISDPTMTTIQEQGKTDSDFYETTSIPPNLLGMPSQADETATAVTSHVANANKKIAGVIRNLAYTLFLPAFRMLLRLEQEYETDEFIALVTGKKLGWGFPSDGAPPSAYIQGEFDLKVEMGVDKKIQLNKLFLIMDRANQVNATTASMLQMGAASAGDVSFINTTTIFDRMLPLLGEKNPDEFKVKAVQPPVPTEGGAGVASQTGLNNAPESTVVGLNPEGVNA